MRLMETVMSERCMSMPFLSYREPLHSEAI